MKKTTILWIVLIALVAIFIIGCSAQGGSPPPSGPIGGGC